MRLRGRARATAGLVASRLSTQPAWPWLAWLSAKRRSRPRWPKTMAVMNMAWSLAEATYWSPTETNHGLEAETRDLVSKSRPAMWSQVETIGRDSIRAPHVTVIIPLHCRLPSWCWSPPSLPHSKKITVIIKENYSKILYPKIGSIIFDLIKKIK